ncbi:hypothetical protein J6590_052906 [Homalodisca vitripennis]|nr:hypothetical protein J6590_052906 [Homalodisca vitripennis]
MRFWNKAQIHQQSLEHKDPCPPPHVVAPVARVFCFRLEEELRFSTGPCRRGFKTRTDQRAGRNASPDTSLTDQLIAGPTEQKKMSTHRV